MDELKNKPLNNQEFDHEDEIDIKEMWRITRSYYKSIGLIFSFVISVTIYATLTTRPIYEASTVVMIKENRVDPSSFVFDFGINSSKQQLQNEIEVLKSYNLHDQVVQSLILDGSSHQLALFGTRYVRKRFRLMDYFLEWIQRTPDTLAIPQELDFAKRIKVIGVLRKSTVITGIRGADALKISVISSDSSEAVFLANRISKIYRNLDLAGGQGDL
ncbi:hypothetical protein HQ531_06715, partial [bacterium]|nr:hypothetical protein [bacterium]